MARKAGVLVGARVDERLDEAPQRLLDARAQAAPERPLQRARVLGHLAADRDDHLLGEGREDRTQRVAER